MSEKLTHLLFKLSFSGIIACIIVPLYGNNGTADADKFKGEVKSVYESVYDIAPNANVTSDNLGKKTFDKNGKIIQHNYYNQNGIYLYTDTLKYDSCGHYIATYSSSAIHNFINNIGHNYDSNCRLLNDTVYDTNGDKRNRVISRFDAEGNRVESDCYLRDTLVLICLASFNSLNQKVEELDSATSNAMQGPIWQKTIYTYFNGGKQVRKEIYLHSGLREKYITYFNSHGNEIRYLHYNSKGLISDTKQNYKYDRMGNWVKEEVFLNRRSLYCIKREIEYY